MSKKIQLSIAEPCHENWDGMTPVEKGKFCGSCQKQVVDFSNMSDRQIAEFFKKPSTGSVCGRFMTDQLERDIEIPRKRIPWVKYFFQIALPAFFISKASAQNIKMGKLAKPPVKDTIRVPAMNEIRTLGMVLPKTIEPVCNKDTGVVAVKGEIKYIDNSVVKGKVINEDGEAISFASIETGQAGIGVMADHDGLFKISKELVANRKLIVSSVGFETKEFTVDIKSTDEVVFQLTTKTLSPVAINAYGTTRMGKVVTGTCTTVMGGYTVSKKVDQIAPVIEKIIPSKDNSLKIYPNPVLSGSTINLTLNKMEEGYYSLQIVGLSGQLVEQKEIWIDNEARVLAIQAPQVAAGNYFMSLVNKKTGKKFTEKIIIQ